MKTGFFEERNWTVQKTNEINNGMRRRRE